MFCFFLGMGVQRQKMRQGSTWNAFGYMPLEDIPLCMFVTLQLPEGA